MNITVVIPLYNKKNSILDTLDSVFKQTFLPKEIIIINDGSSDSSEKLVEKLNHPLIRLFNQTNAGVSAARNSGIGKATCEWIAFLDADDEWKPEYLETIKFLSNNYPYCQVLATAYELEDHKGNRKQITLNKIPFSGSHGELNNYFEVASCSHPPICSSAVIVKKEAIIGIGGFPIGIKSGEDLLTWARLAVYFDIAYFKKPLAIFIKNLPDVNDLRLRGPTSYDEVGVQLKLLLNYCSINQFKNLKKYISRWHRMRYLAYVKSSKNYRLAIMELLNCFKFNPTNLKNYGYLLFLIIPSLTTKKK